ncbi:MAG: pyridoxal 5'-phosphate synthase glutaminase subunit PdxT [Chloroflexi bacterium]|nr:pyridoxal 5'-phosphate synthase glutaminase subunit PdxT [Chloroflexota bacterium]MDA1272168.1 pyridoxal 5'-phosphate synthase glutaminase subunit PdxT [Chloroflexota bacterium]PKB59260.1 MAG: glutamine amidotransferase subunit PdxT [SAR202 cluster bacterium Casp-Chloro-G2]
MEVGVLAVQGDFAEHIAVLGKLGVKAKEIRLPHQLEMVDGLIIPGGESTTLSRLMSLYNFREPLQQMAKEGRSIWGTCAGMIMLANEITEEDPVPLGIMDIGVQRNAFGRQVDSFEQSLEIQALGPDPFHAIFIRAPLIIRVGEGVKVLCALDEARPVAVQQGNLMATSFHPELTNDHRFHRFFLDLAGKSCSSRNGSV